MSNETKRDVFEVALNHATKTGWVDYGQLLDRYNAALPDDMPVIMEEVGEYLEWCKKYDIELSDALEVTDFAGGVPPDEIVYLMTTEVEQSLRAYIWHNEDVFARAWVLGVWRVEETGEIVKLEAEK